MKIKAKKSPKSKEPFINIMSLDLLGKENEFDFFPHMSTSGLSGLEEKLTQQLKSGTYMPFMQPVEYSAVFKKGEKRNHILRSATPMAGKKITTDHDIYSADIMEQQERSTVKTRVEVLGKQFQRSTLPMRPRYYHNPLQYFDHVVLSDGYTNSFGGTVIDTWVDFIMPKTIKPVLKLRNPKNSGDKQAQQKEIKKHQEIIETLEGADQWYSDVGRITQDPYMDIPLQQKFRSLITNELTFGRDAAAFENWKHLEPVTVDKVEYKGLPNVIKILHPIDMGMIEIDEFTWKLGGMYVHSDRAYIPSSQMLYLVHQYQSPMIGSFLYGYSKLQRAIDPMRLLRRIFARNYQQFIRTSYSGMGMFVFDSTQYPEDVRKKIRTSIKNSYVAGEIGVIDYANIKDFEWREMKINADIQGLQALQEQLIKVIIGITGIPQSLIFDEAAATRATLVGRIISFINNQITTERTNLSQQISSQWYMRVFRTIYAKDKDILEKFYIDCEFEEMELETKLEKVARLLQETQIAPYTDEYIGEELGDKDYLEHIDDEKRKKQEENPMGGMGMQNKFGKGSGTFSVTDSQTGKVSKVSTE